MALKIRQQALTIDGIRDDHVNRYRFAGEVMGNSIKSIMDIGCGVGYGSWLLASQYGKSVIGYDRDRDAIKYAVNRYSHPNVMYRRGNFTELNPYFHTPVITAFEIIEHVPGAFKWLSAVNADLLIGSVPNEDVVPFNPEIHNKEHYRHFTPNQIKDELKRAGWTVTRLAFQRGKRGVDAVVDDRATTGRTIVFVAERL